MSDVTAAFRAAVEAHDLDAMRACFTPNATFHSPAVHTPYAGIDDVMMVLTGVTMVFEDFSYTGALDASEGGSTHALLFEARVGDRTIQGIDLLTYDADGLVTDLTVMLRPLRGLEAVVAKMGEMLAKLASA